MTITSQFFLPGVSGPLWRGWTMILSAVITWLLEEEQPAIRHLTLAHLLRKPADDPEVVAAKERIPKTGWASAILSARRPDGTWVDGESLYRPKYHSTNWMLLTLSELGLTNEDPRIAKSCDVWI